MRERAIVFVCVVMSVISPIRASPPSPAAAAPSATTEGPALLPAPSAADKPPPAAPAARPGTMDAAAVVQLALGLCARTHILRIVVCVVDRVLYVTPLRASRECLPLCVCHCVSPISRCVARIAMQSAAAWRRQQQHSPPPPCCSLLALTRAWGTCSNLYARYQQTLPWRFKLHTPTRSSGDRSIRPRPRRRITPATR